MNGRNDFAGDKGQRHHGSQQDVSRQLSPVTLKRRSEQRALVVGFQNPLLDGVGRRRHPDMISHGHADRRRDAEQLVLLLAETCRAAAPRIDRQHAGMDVAKVLRTS